MVVSFKDIQDENTDLKAKNEQLNKENEQLRAENNDLRVQAQYFQSLTSIGAVSTGYFFRAFFLVLCSWLCLLKKLDS